MPARVEIIIQNEESKWQHVAHHAGLKIILYLSRILTPGREGAGQEDPMFVLGLVPLDLENFGPHLAPVTMMTGSEKALQFCPVAHFPPWGFCDEMPGEAYVQEGRQGSTPE